MNPSPERTSDALPLDIVVATGNPGKLTEIRDLLGPRYRVISAGELQATMPEETGTSFTENALLKAVAIAGQTGMTAIADDSGLEVAALKGAPGVRTARFAGPAASDSDNRKKLLDALIGVDDDNRTARFVSVIAIAFSPKDVVTAIGTCEGSISLRERGENGFGYDSLFEVSSGKTMAEMTPEEKNTLSHRGQAMEKARRILEDRFNSEDVQNRGAGS